MKQLSARTMRIIGWVIIASCFIGGIVLGIVFKREDADILGTPIMVFDMWLMLITWLVGGIGGLIFIGKSYSRQ